MSIQEAIKDAVVDFLKAKGRRIYYATGYRERSYYYGEVEVEIYYIDDDYDPCTFTYYGTLGDLIKEIEPAWPLS